jgi:hypothetical protein
MIGCIIGVAVAKIDSEWEDQHTRRSEATAERRGKIVRGLCCPFNSG